MAPVVDPKTVGLTTSAVQVLAADPQRREVYFTNEEASGGDSLRLGPSGVTANGTDATDGILLIPEKTLPFVGEGAMAEWYAIAESGTPELSIIEVKSF